MDGESIQLKVHKTFRWKKFEGILNFKLKKNRWKILKLLETACTLEKSAKRQTSQYSIKVGNQSTKWNLRKGD